MVGKKTGSSGKNPKVIFYKPERIKTGIPGLDKLIDGGLVKGSSVLISGGTGTGKTIFCLRCLWEGLQNDESGIYITLEETAEDLRRDALGFGWDLKKYEKKSKFKFVEKNILEDTNFEFFDVDRMKASRIVIDSISLLSLVVEDKSSMRGRLQELVKSLKERKITTLLISESIDEEHLSILGIEEFIVDGVIHLKSIPMGKMSQRTIEIRKMRETKINEGIHSMEFCKNGIKVVD
ncbi:MAG: ATPase [Candidatus Aenigmarchaeota archaeon]|nr:ATPase [Candidatus Aenigmarchaeota archaeon]